MAERHIGVALDFSPSSNYALKWALDNLVRDGDTLFLILVNKNTDLEESKIHLWGVSGSPLIPFVEFTDSHVLKNYGLDSNEEVNTLVAEALKEKKIKVLGKVYYGDAREKLCDAILDLSMDALVMGSRGLGGLKRVFLGSVSNYVVNNAPCPITVVKLPESSSS
ncbi:hypothetical protein MPTK1_6g16930 [Marchantia polymorpha subsp. ruderalis]|uniref:UspA domain-containing protein n=2 Tax=Marchantia polymorpha TaxID=3197 RepID=A0A176VP92_MARPO|nr:hypothetical protein AXG93_2619s1040 [Marchantia polymorpha subsp. ruderalis]PTQ26728.1 hypothetical protein MARPO_0510s0002 [Marchantia polymorpha]BBN15089.1 hypothetical protein Mp_6g16930 [Marchantia polymorpha subsp. ruderalis]|eukprot:PTQ26728.1 hypothetical protein MARPO_0510s0002 [Marchantia polymorpha]